METPSSTPIELREQLSYSLRRQYVDGFLFQVAQDFSLNLRLLDIGGEEGERRGRFSLPRAAIRYVSLNVSRKKRADLCGNAESLPINSQTFDIILCSEVLEHVSNPIRVVTEAHRALRSGGQLIITVPFLYRLHADPVDVGRYTPWFWKSELERIGFRNVVIQKQGLFWSVWADMFRDWLRHLVVDRRVRSRFLIWLFPRLVRRTREFALRRDKQPDMSQHNFYGRYVGGFGIVATKAKSP
jgi:SAM-dependent methyltransferase